MKKKLTIHQKRARVGTAIFTMLLLIFLFFFGLTYIDPAPEGGIAINFGYEDAGSGHTTSAPTPSEPTPPTPVEETPETVDEVATQDVEDAPVVNKEEEKKPKQDKKEPKETEKEPEKPKEPVKEEPKPSDELSKMLGKVSNQDDAGEGEGEKTGGGDQGDPDGDKNSNNRIGSGQGSGAGNYRLGGRGALQQPKPKYDCAEEGRVVVKVYVDRNGKVKNAIGGEQIPNGPSSTTTSSCLLKRAEEAARKTTWAADAQAPEQQIGYIIYNFLKN